MASIGELYQLKGRYQNLRTTVSSIISRIDSSALSLSLSVAKIGEYYNVDGETYDKRELASTKGKLSSKSSELKHSVLPAISAKISEIDAEIERLEEEERRAAEEAARLSASSRL